MNKKMKVIISVLTFILVLSVCISVFATTIDGVTINPSDPDASVSTLGNKVLGIIRAVGIFAAVGILMIVGVRYMMGSAEEKAEYKKVMIPYVIGAILLFGAAVFADKLASIAKSLFG